MDIHQSSTKMRLSFSVCFHKAENPLRTDGTARHGTAPHGAIRFVRKCAGPNEASLLIIGFGHSVLPSCAYPGGEFGGLSFNILNGGGKSTSPSLTQLYYRRLVDLLA